MKKIVYVDMDGVLCNYSKEYYKRLKQNPAQKYPQSDWGFFIALEEIPGAIQAIKLLSKYFEIRILTKPSIYNLNSYTEKAFWVLEHLGLWALEKLDMSCNKSLFIGDYLIDDSTGDGQEYFSGELILFGSSEFPNWKEIVMYLLKDKFFD